MSADGIFWGVLIATALTIFAKMTDWASRRAQRRWEAFADRKDRDHWADHS